MYINDIIKTSLSRVFELFFAIATLLLIALNPVVADSSHDNNKIPIPGRMFTLSQPGLALGDANNLLIAADLINTSNQDALKVKIHSIRLDSALTLTSTPVNLNKIDAGMSEIVQAGFNIGNLTAGKSYNLVLKGSYLLKPVCEQEDHSHKQKHDNKHDKNCKHEDEDEDHDFIVKTVVVLPPSAPGSAPVASSQVPSNQVNGGKYPHQPLDFDNDVNKAAPPIPTAPFVTGTPTPTGTNITPAPFGDPPAITFNANNSLGLTSGTTNGTASTVAEPSGASGGGVVFVTANWTAAYSTNGGATYTQLDPTTIFPNDAVGYCCDQIVQYVPSINRFVWLLQGNGYRLAMASPTDIINSGGTAWTYWNLTPQVFGEATTVSFDYPDMSVGNNELYISWDGNGGFQVARTSLAGINGGGTISIDYTHPSDSPSGITWGDHLTQNTLDEVFWAGHNGNNKLRVYSLQEGSNTYYWRDIGISSWANNAPVSTTPDGQDWLAKNFHGPGGNTFPRNGVLGATRSGNQLWFAWTAGTDSNFQQAHVEMVTLDRSNNFNKIQQVQIWNNSYAFAYPALATNACTGEIGLSFEYGGNGNYENHVVGFWGDYVAYITTGSNVGSTRFGDYVSIRQAPFTDADRGNLFTAFGYGLNSVPPPKTGTNSDVHYVLFGRPASSCSPIIK